MELQLEGKRALVTGSTSGIGETIAKTLAAEGVAVVIHGRREQQAIRVIDEITQAGGKAAIAIGDLSTDEGAVEVVRQALKAFDGIDILVNNAGICPDESWFDTPSAQWNNIYNQNVGSMVRLIQQLVPGMKEQGWGRVISISSVVGSMALAERASYSATKAAIINLGVSLTKELANTGITSNIVSPGVVATTMIKELIDTQAKQEGVDVSIIEKRWAEELYPNSIGRMGQPQDIANAVIFLASHQAEFINGANLRVDGGMNPTIN
jgi:3-oxoacyl-[acyl-carrier protein] reductase